MPESLSLAEWLLIAGFALVALEIVTPSFLFLGFGLGAFAVAALAALGDPGIATMLAVFAVVSAASFFVLRRLFRKPGDTHVSEDDVNRY